MKWQAEPCFSVYLGISWCTTCLSYSPLKIQTGLFTNPAMDFQEHDKGWCRRFYRVSHLCVLVSVELAKAEQQEQDRPQLIRKPERETAGCLPHSLPRSCYVHSCCLMQKKSPFTYTNTAPTTSVFPWLNLFFLAFPHILPELESAMNQGYHSFNIRALPAGHWCIYKLNLHSSLEKGTNIGELIVQLWADMSGKQNTGHQSQ